MTDNEFTDLHGDTLAVHHRDDDLLHIDISSSSGDVSASAVWLDTSQVAGLIASLLEWQAAHQPSAAPLSDEGKECIHCSSTVILFNKAPEWAQTDDTDAGWATDLSGDIGADFVCPAREATGRFPDGKPHEVRSGS